MKKSYLRLPDSELDIMLILWNGHSGMSRLEIQHVLNEKKILAPTTILSLLNRLEKKNFVSVEKQGKQNLYTPLIMRDEYQHNESESMLEKLYGNSLKNFVASLYHGKKISPEKVKELNDFLQELEDQEE